MADPLLLGALALLLFGRKQGGSSGGGSAKPAASDTSPPDPQWANTDGTKLHARANQAAALAWAPIFMDAGATPMEAQAMARWVGLESSGNTHPTTGNGGGLMQVGKGFVDMGALTPSEYAKLQNPSTTSKEQAVLALKYVRWLWGRAKQYVAQPPSNPVDQVWYAYLYHMRPVDVRDSHLHGEAGPMAAALYPVWSISKQALHRLHAANVVAFDNPGGELPQ